MKLEMRECFRYTVIGTTGYSTYWALEHKLNELGKEGYEVCAWNPENYTLILKKKYYENPE